MFNALYATEFQTLNLFGESGSLTPRGKQEIGNLHVERNTKGKQKDV
jgi:hypothetical protein